MRFRLACMDLGERYTQTELNIIAGVFVTISLIICYLELQFQYMAKFYRKRLTIGC